MANITDEQIKAILDLEGLDEKAIQKKITAIKVTIGSWSDAVDGLDAKTKLLLTTMSDDSWVKAWTESLEKQIYAKEVLGEISGELEKQQYVRDQAIDTLQQELDTLIKTQKQRQQAVNTQKELVEGLEAQGGESDKVNAAKEKLIKLQKSLKTANEDTSKEDIKTLALKLRQLKAQSDLADRAEDMIGTITGIGDQWKRSFIGAIVESGAAVEGFGAKISAIGTGLAEGFAKAMTPMNLFMSGIQKIIEVTIGMVFEFDEAEKEFRQIQGVGEEWDTSIRHLHMVNKEYTLSVKDNAEALEAVRSGMTTLRTRTQESATSIAEFIGPLRNIGISAKLATEGMDTLINTLGQTQPEAEATTHRIISLALAIGRPPAEMIKEFNAAMPKLAVHGKNAEKVFKGMQATAAAVGVEMSRLLEIAEGFDTFEDAGRKVGSLNAVLGGAFFNSMEMLKATNPEERIKLMMEGFQASGKSFEQLSYFQQKAVAAAMGLKNVGEATRMLSGTALQAVEAMKKKAKADEDEAKAQKLHEQTMKDNVKLQKEMMEGMKEFGQAAAPVLDIIRDLFKILKPFLMIIGAVTGVLGDLVAAFTQLTAPVEKAAEAVGALDTLWANFRKRLEDVPDWAVWVVGIAAITVGLYALAVGFAVMSAPMIAITLAVIAFGAAILAAIHSPPLYIGIGLLAIEIIALAAALFPLALGMASAAVGAFALGLSLFTLALGFGALAVSLAFIKTDDLVALGNIFQGLGNFAAEGAVKISNLPGVIKSIVKGLDDLDIDKLDRLAESLWTLSNAAMALKAVGTIGFGAEGTIGAKALVGAHTKTAEEITGRVASAAEIREQTRILTTATISAKESTKIMKETGVGAATATATAPIKVEMPKGVLVTRDIVVDLGSEFDFVFERKVKKLVEEKLNEK